MYNISAIVLNVKISSNGEKSETIRHTLTTEHTLKRTHARTYARNLYSLQFAFQRCSSDIS